MLPALGFLTDKGTNLEALHKNSGVNKIGIDGNLLGVKNIHDAISVVDSLCTDWIILLDQLKLRKGLDHPTKKYRGGSLDLITEKLANHEIKEAKKLLENNGVVYMIELDSIHNGIRHVLVRSSTLSLISNGTWS